MPLIAFGREGADGFRSLSLERVNACSMLMNPGAVHAAASLSPALNHDICMGVGCFMPGPKDRFPIGGTASDAPVSPSFGDARPEIRTKRAGALELDYCCPRASCRTRGGPTTSSVGSSARTANG